MSIRKLLIVLIAFFTIGNVFANDVWFRVCNASGHDVVLSFNNTNNTEYDFMKVSVESEKSNGTLDLSAKKPLSCFNVHAWSNLRFHNTSSLDIKYAYRDAPLNNGKFSIGMITEPSSNCSIENIHDKNAYTCIHHLRNTFVSVASGSNFYWGQAASKEFDISEKDTMYFMYQDE